jgi:antitoxin (DNA-binding transcriptional repressor) of toxin-antitoxin stability system
MKTISIRELHERTGAWVRKAVELGAITVTERGKPLVRLEAVTDVRSANPFRERHLRPEYARLRGKLGGGTDTTTIISEDRDRKLSS